MVGKDREQVMEKRELLALVRKEVLPPVNLPSFVLSENIKCLLPWAVHTRKRKWDQGETVGWTIPRGIPVPSAVRRIRS